MAAGHWLAAMWEDCRCVAFLGAGADERLFDGHDPNTFLAKAYLLHHMVAASGFMTILMLRCCTGLGAFGLLFELPVLLMNHRELALHERGRGRRASWMY
eukprot:CAMPEP_0206522026 /NCGR_PEP_ID=MMETSP0324_2-20121206/66725_1 /ASSEMBLY_ACC=CAM_ASM_000836 /TAXON_ID=2866 /ORGANISM="Crypthecodinium cohnii, Strain Seligo" /LENGTH=99 /DNA_ID=CAMNT_0054016087 /DNA_START=25 /DNA_END=321 /DNA_ORIENTATION=-